MGIFDWIRGKKPEVASSPLPPDAMLLANDIVLSVLIQPPGGSADKLLKRVEAGELTPVVMDASLFWAMSSVQASDTMQTDRMARLLRYARILPLDSEGDARGHTVASPEEIEHWRSVVFDRGEASAVPPEQPGDEGEAPAMLCSQCYTQCSGPDAHVIPWWNPSEADFFTTYRCGACWLESLDETDARTSPLDEDTRAKFCAFLHRHRLDEIATQIEHAALPEASVIAAGFLEQVRSQATVLRP